MQLTVFSLGKIKTDNYASLQAYYEKLTQQAPKSLSINSIQVKDKTPDQKLNPERFLDEQGLNSVNTYFLAEWGREYSTAEFIQFVNKHYQEALDINLVVGNAYGWMASSKSNSQLKFLSLSKLVMSHELAQVVLWEQLFRLTDRLTGGNYSK